MNVYELEKHVQKDQRKGHAYTLSARKYRILLNLVANSLRERFCLQISKSILMKTLSSTTSKLYLKHLQPFDLLATTKV